MSVVKLFIVGLAIAFGCEVLLALLLQFIWGWFAASFGWPPLPFWIAFAIVFLIGCFTGATSVTFRARD